MYETVSPGSTLENGIASCNKRSQIVKTANHYESQRMDSLNCIPTQRASLLRETHSKILSMELESIKHTVMNSNKYDWSLDECDAAEIAYREFLTICALHPTATIVPTIEVDEFWHAHILDTLKYHKDCFEYLGFFLHHEPKPLNELNSPLHTRSMDCTLELWSRYFPDSTASLFASCQSTQGGTRCATRVES